MSIGGPSALGTLLVHRLDSVLGTTLSQQANLVSGARPDAVSQPGHPERADPAQNETHRQTRDGVDRAMAQSEQPSRQAIDRARIDARAAELLAARSAPSTSTTKSAPTSLGHAAKVILALLANFPDEAPPVQGKAPLLGGGGQRPAEASNSSPNAGASGSTANTSSGANASAGTSANAAAANSARAETAPAAGRGPNTSSTPAASGGTSTLSGPATAAAIAQQPNSVPAQLAQALAQALQNSGIFYESHLNNLAFGKHSLSQLQQEPQAQAGRGTTTGAAPGANSSSNSGAPATPSNPPGTAVAARTDNPAATGQGGRSEALASPPGSQAASTPASGAAGNSPLPVPGLDPQTHQLVRQQLEILANQTFAWRGEAWPNAPMEWEIHRREPSKEDTDLSVETDHWATRINIHLPMLGSVQARLTLAGQQLVMHLIAPESSALLSEHTETLRGRYSALGMQLSQLSVAGNAWEAAGSGRQTVEDSIAAMYQPQPGSIDGPDAIDGSSSR